jgi:hypothetical protein
MLVIFTFNYIYYYYVASLMSRGVGHVDDFPWQAGAAAVALTVFGLVFKYVKEAFDFQED